MGDISINLGESLAYLELRFLELIGQDPGTKETKEWFNALQQTAAVQASRVQCIGMHQPLRLEDIYQPTKLKVRRSSRAATPGESFVPQDKVSRSITQGHDLAESVVGVDEFLRRRENAIVYAGPGWGKTTFIHHVYMKSIRASDVMPVLISLRRPTAADDLHKFVNIAQTIQKKQTKSKVLLLIDGYDELPISARKSVSEAVLRYQALQIGSFYITCREYYHVFDVAAPEARIDGFTAEDQYRYVETFLSAFGSPLNPVKVVDELRTRGFDDFLAHPLLLALACIVKTSSMSVQSRSVLRLLERAIEVLTYRWDEDKGVDRPSRTPLDGRDRIQILKRIAYNVKTRHISASRALKSAKKQLDLLGFDRIDPQQVLLETAQFFGIFVPAEEGWEFVHKTLQDFLAAQFWVETGGFANSTTDEWTARTAYAACLTQDATSVMERALLSSQGIEAFVEILSNAPVFDPKRIADALITYYSKQGSVHYYEFETPYRTITAHLDQDFVRLANSSFLEYLIDRCLANRGKTTDTIAAYCLFEINSRGQKVSQVIYDKLLAAYKSPLLTFHLLSLGHVRLGVLNPLSPDPQV